MDEARGCWGMDLQESKARVLRTLIDLIHEGSELRDGIDREYRHKRSQGIFYQDRDMIAWSNRYRSWYVKCLAKIVELFEPSILVTNRFKNPQIDALYPDGENMKWASLMKHINARLALLDNLYELVSVIREDELSDYVELNIPLAGFGKIKVHKIISKLSER
jgi:hypothetical protein